MTRTERLVREAESLGIFRPLALARVANARGFESIKQLASLTDQELGRYSQVGPKVIAKMKCLSLCSGIGGLELGLSMVSDLTPVAFVERDKYCRTVLAARWPGVVQFINVADVEKIECDIVTAGFPCQPWSVSGKRKGKQDERWIWPEIARVVRESRPRWVFLENVPGIISGGGLAAVLWSLAQIGFDAAWSVLSCAGLGASHIRERVFIVAYASLRGCDEPRRTADTGVCQLTGYFGTLANAYPTKSGEGLEQRQQPKPAQHHRPTFWPGGPMSSWTCQTPWPAEPRVHRVDDGLPRSLERPKYTARVRALGNSVSPPVAAVAWSLLSSRLLSSL